jgi:hypothetical protein
MPLSFFNALIGVAILFTVIMLWVGVQALARKSEGLPPDCDMIGDTARACSHCGQYKVCPHVKENTE